MRSSKVMVFVGTAFLLTPPSIARAECVCQIPPETKYVIIEADDIAVYKSPSLGKKSVDFVAASGSIFAVEGGDQQDGKLLVVISVDGEKHWIETECAQLSESTRMRFARSEAVFPAFGDPSDFHESRLASAPPCKVEENRKKAAALFEKAFENMEAKKYPEALRMFFDGLMLDSDNPLALFYLAEISRIFYTNKLEWPPETFKKNMFSELFNLEDKHLVEKEEVIDLYQTAVAKGLSGVSLERAKERLRALRGPIN